MGAQKLYHRRMMPRWLSVFCLAGAVVVVPPASAQTKKKDDKKAQKDEAKKGDEPKPEPKKDDDVVFDNTAWAKKKEQERQQQQEADPTFANDTPFANTAPDPVALREQRWKPGFGGGYRLGWAFPMGHVTKDAKLSEGVTGLIFLWGDFGYWPIPELFVGLYLSGGYVLPDCKSGASCSAWEVRGGPEVIWRILPFENTTPFVGVAGGYEWMMFKGSTSISEVTERYHGFELANFQAGVDVKTRGAFYGIFLAYSLGQFGKFSRDSSITGQPERSSSGSIDEKGTHSWLAIGARGTLE